MSEPLPKKKIAAIKGTHDILPSQVSKWQKVENTAKAIFERYGYREIRTPVFEATELFEKGTGETSDIVMKEMYTFTDKGGRSLTLRPEYTPSIARAIIEHRLHLLPDPMRYYFIGPMFRYDKPQKGRYRQFHQMDVEVFNEKAASLDAEIVELAANLLESVGVISFEIRVNSVGCRECRPMYQQNLQQAAEENRANFCEDCQRKIDTNPLRIFDCKVEICQDLARHLPKIMDSLCPECETHFRAFLNGLDLYGLSYSLDPLLVRGLDYYTKTTFEFTSSQLGAQDAILGGGRYDDMMRDFGGPDICGIGFALGFERLLLLLPESEEKARFVFLVWLGESARQEAIKTARTLRRSGVECRMEYKERSLRNQMSRASKLGAAWTIIVGEDEVSRGIYQLKDMASGEQKEVLLDELLSQVMTTD